MSAISCVVCGAACSKVGPSWAVCAFCRDGDARATTLLAKSAPRVRPKATVSSNLIVSSWRVQRIPGDGNCLFASMVWGKMCLLGESAESPRPATITKWAEQTRRAYLQYIRTGAAEGRKVFDEFDLETLVRASTDMSLSRYLKKMEAPQGSDRSTWGGFLETSLICHRWRCRALFFVPQAPGGGEAPKLRLWSYVGDDVAASHKHRGRIPLLWSGVHYEVLCLPDDVIAKLP